MREILFRGKCRETKRWYYGQYIKLHKTTYCFEEYKDNDIDQIVFEEMTDWNLPNRHLRVDVIPETIGQFTGLIDKNGKKIFEGDIVQGTITSQWSKSVIRCEVVYIRDCFISLEIDKMGRQWTHKLLFAKDIQVIGNIYDNQELLKN